jgi:hypothetical protein
MIKIIHQKAWMMRYINIKMKYIFKNFRSTINCLKVMSTKLNIKNICTSFLYKYIKDLVSVKTPIALVFIYYLYSNT